MGQIKLTNAPRKLIEVALPLDAINEAAALEKQPFTRHHPRSLHIWWARRPFTAARAVIFAQLVNDPGYQQGGGFKYGKNKKEAAEERKRLFKILEDLVLWDSTDNESVLDRARAEIRRSWREVCELNKDHPQAAELFNPARLPGLHDPFAGGGAIPLEAQRLGLEAYASDLNPVAVLINKAMIEIPPKFAGRSPVGPVPPDESEARLDLPKTWPGAVGLGEDVRRYGLWIRAEAQKRIGGLYPPVEITAEMARERPDLKPLVGRKLRIIAWIWARTVKSPNPAFSHVEVPLASNFILSSKEGKEAYLQPVVDGDYYWFTVRIGPPPPRASNGTKLSRGANFSCLVSGVPIDPSYIKTEAIANRMGTRLMAVVTEGLRRRIYLEPTTEMETVAAKAEPMWTPDGCLVDDARAFTPTLYGLRQWRDLFTPRQLVALTTFSDLVAEAREKIRQEALAAGVFDDGKGLEGGGSGATAYAEAISTYLGIAVSRWADMNNTICTWNTTNTNIRALFSRQAIQMTWDFVELSAFAPIAGFDSVVNSFAELAQSLPASVDGRAEQADAQTQRISSNKVISTDPPYYDNVPYADLSDFFYIWLRRMLKPTFPSLFSTLAAPKTEELVALAYRHGGAEGARNYFLNGMMQAMQNLADQAHPEGPITIYYAFKQSETEGEVGTASTGWETFLEAVNKAGMQLTGTWPMRTERAQRSRGIGSNALASSIVLVCRKRPAGAPTISRREFIRELNAVLPGALDEMTRGSGDDVASVAPVDLSQAIIGPGIAVFSKYAAVLEADGKAMSVKSALQLINRFLAEDDFDADTQFCLHWFQQYGWKEGKFGDADTLARAKGTSVDGVKQSGVLYAAGGIVRLFRWADYPADWDPRNDARLPVWEVLHQLIRIFRTDGESGAGAVLASMQAKAEATRQLAYRLYTQCERAGWAEDARAYNEVVTSWSNIEAAATRVPSPQQADLFEG